MSFHRSDGLSNRAIIECNRRGRGGAVEPREKREKRERVRDRETKREEMKRGRRDKKIK